MFKLLRISGHSLLPTYRDGDYVLISRIPHLFRPVKQGDIVAFRHKTYGLMIKKVHSVVPERSEIYVIGTHEASVDSRHFGAIRRKDVLGTVIWHIARPFHPPSPPRQHTID